MPDPSRPVAGGALETGSLVADRYRLDSPLAAGGMATVWRATDEVLARPVALKVLHVHLAADPSFVARFRREAVAAARLAHPSIVAIYDTCSDPEAIVMELVEGRTLRDELDGRPFLPPAEAVEIACGIAQALEVAHKAGLVHRDVKPANVLLTPDGQVKVADFGIAKAARPDEDPELPDLTSVGHMVGTAKYLAPEQVSGGDIDARTDVYALGAVLYEMVTGRPPFSGANDLATATARLHAMPERPRSVLRTVPPRLDEIVMKALATAPADRYDSAAALWADLQAAPLAAEAGGAVGTATAAATDATVITSQKSSFAKSERSWLVPAVLVTLVAVALGLAWLLIGGTEARRDLFDLVDRVAPGGGNGRAQPVAVEELRAIAFDPFGTGGENDDLAGLAVDDDPATSWQTERYNSRLLGGLKPGVGIVLDVGEARELDTLTIETPDSGWVASIHVADDLPGDYDGWGEAKTTVETGQAGSNEIDLDRVRGSYVLVWLTDLGDDAGVRFTLSELDVTAR